MVKNRRLSALLAVGALALSGITAVATAGPAAAEIFKERWCSSGVAKPCVISATHNGNPLSPGDDIEVQMISKQVTGDQIYTQVLVYDPSDPAAIATSDTISVYVDLGNIRPDTTESYAFRPDVDRFNDGDGTFKLRFTGKPVLLTSGCTDTYPNVCTDTAETQQVTFDVTIIKQLVNLDLAQFDRAQSADTVDGPFLVESSTGDYLETYVGNSRFLTDGTTRARASARFRIPYRMLVSDFRIPAPETMVASSMTGTINGAPAMYSFSQDPDGGGVFVDIDNVTFGPGTGATRSALAAAAAKPRTIRVKKGVITPTRPILERATRTAPRRTRITFLRAKPRGAYVTGYQARCAAVGKPTVIVNGKYPTIVMTGLRAGTKYQCSVRAKSRVGYGAWSLRKQV